MASEVNQETALAAAYICLTEVRTLFDLQIFTVQSFEEHALQQQTELLRHDARNVASFINQAMSDTIDRYRADGIFEALQTISIRLMLLKAILQH